jgi:hypothetical protein
VVVSVEEDLLSYVKIFQNFRLWVYKAEEKRAHDHLARALIPIAEARRLVYRGVASILGRSKTAFDERAPNREGAVCRVCDELREINLSRLRGQRAQRQPNWGAPTLEH